MEGARFGALATSFRQVEETRQCKLGSPHCPGGGSAAWGHHDRAAPRDRTLGRDDLELRSHGSPPSPAPRRLRRRPHGPGPRGLLDGRRPGRRTRSSPQPPPRGLPVGDSRAEARPNPHHRPYHRRQGTPPGPRDPPGHSPTQPNHAPSPNPGHPARTHSLGPPPDRPGLGAPPRPPPGRVRRPLPRPAQRRHPLRARVPVPEAASSATASPQPEVNARLGPFLIDCLWRSERLAAELDGYASHSGRQAFEDDRARDAYLVAHGYTVLRFTWRQVTHEPRLVASTVRVALHA